MTERRVIDKTQQRPADIAAAMPIDQTPKPAPIVPPSAIIEVRAGAKARPDQPPRTIPILASPVVEQVPIRGASKINSLLTLGLTPEKGHKKAPGGAEGQVMKKRNEQASAQRDARMSTSVIK